MAETLVPTELLTGIGEMDTQHDHLFQEMQKVKDALLADASEGADGLSLLSGLANELAQHFAWEEGAASEHGIPFQEHAREHGRIIAFIDNKIAEIDRGVCNIPALMVFMERKFESHVVHYDLMLGRALKSAVAPAVRQQTSDAV